MTQSYDQSTMPSAGPKMAPSQQPIGDAVTTAFDKSDVHDLDPKLIAQITENVIKQLRQVNLQPTTSQPQTSFPEPGTQSASTLPDGTDSDKTSQLAKSSTESVNHTTAPGQPDKMSTEKHTETAAMDSSEPKAAGSEPDEVRPKGPVRLSTSLEETPLERIWGPLFDEKGLPTARFHQVLRGLGVHLIEDYEPKNSLVITPAKMVRYYRESKLEKEYYPWPVIFDDEDTYMSRMYRELGCEHHLVQENVYERPEVPGLTPAGFATWMTVLLLAHPEDEFERLKLSVVNMPISNPDDRRERFPKDISRRLFPTQPDAKSRNDLRRAICKHSKSAKIDPLDDDGRLGEHSFPKPSTLDPAAGSKSARPRGSSPGDRDSLPVPPIERERQPYRSSAGAAPPLPGTFKNMPTVGSEQAIADDDHPAPPMPIERERKPYHSTPGGGKTFEEPVSNRSSWHAKSANGAGNPAYVPAGTGTVYPPPPRQRSVGPNSTQPGLSRANSGRSAAGRVPTGGSPTYGNERGPPPAPSAGTAASAGPSLEIHQQVPPPPPPSNISNHPREGSFSHRRAPSVGGAYVSSEPRPINDDLRNPQPTFHSGSYDSHRPVYVERAGGHDGYGTYGEDYARRSRGSSIGQNLPGPGPGPGPSGRPFAGVAMPPNARRESYERRRSPPRWGENIIRTAGVAGEESYRDGGRY